MGPVVPSNTSKGPPHGSQLLLRIQAETVFDRPCLRYKVTSRTRARRGICRTGMRICDGPTPSSLAGVEGSTCRDWLLWCASVHRLHGHRKESSGTIIVVTLLLYTRRVSHE
jgi:hypothetical protein